MRAAAIPVAPNRMKQPITTVMPRRSSSLPESMSSPIVATAMTATVVAVDPNATPCTQATPSTIGLCAGGSVSGKVGEYMGTPTAIISGINRGAAMEEAAILALIVSERRRFPLAGSFGGD